MPTIAPDVYRAIGLRESEYERIVELLGREPSATELGMFAVMWSEHCGYKHSRPVLRRFAEYKRALEGEGFENAGVVEIESGWCVALKIESHNHPSAVEPYQGAATGVGGIIRDIFAMGARPVACLNSLRFGPIQGSDATAAHNRYLFERVVAGIGGYSNCVGVPTVGGEVNFDEGYNGNPLVNAMCVGLIRTDAIASAEARGVGNPVVYLGSATGRDGIHGATFASDALGEDSHQDLPNVQIGDPFTEKALIEATLEALDSGGIVAIQDMGAAGITCSTIEMSAKGGIGMEINLDEVPTRAGGMSAQEIMLSESQERMLAVVRPERLEEVMDIFRKWEQRAAVIGCVTESGRVRITHRGEVVADVDPHHLADECPTYVIEPVEPDSFRLAESFDATDLPDAIDPAGALLRLLSHPDIASKRWVFRQYDQQVQTQTLLLPGEGDAAVLNLRGPTTGIAVTVDGNSRWTSADPFVGGQLAVFEAARNLSCVGARAVATTDGLNFGNPESPHVYWQLQQCVEGIATACEALGAPVISGNASLYNESERGQIPPTPIIGMVGVIEDATKCVGSAIPKRDCVLLLLGYESDWGIGAGLGASLALRELHGIVDGRPIPPSPEGEVALVGLLCDLAANELMLAAHDCSDGGLAVAIAEMLIPNGVGANLDLPDQERLDSALFGEAPGRVLVACEDVCAIQSRLVSPIVATPLGQTDVSTKMLRIEIAGKLVVESNVESLDQAFQSSIPDLMDSSISSA